MWPRSSVPWQEAILYLLMIVYVLPHTSISNGLNRLVGVDLYGLLSGAYGLSSDLLANQRIWAISASLFSVSAWLSRHHALAQSYVLVGALLIGDVFLSTADPYPYARACACFLALITFGLTLQASGRASWQWLLSALLIAITVQSAYAIAYYLLEIDLFVDPRFGPRAGGTFRQPAFLYPLCVFGCLACAALLNVPLSRQSRAFLLVAASVNFIAVWCGFARGAWVGLACGITTLAFVQDWRHKDRNRFRWALAIVLALALGTLFVRTKGAVLGSPEDRSALGRLAIWETALGIFAGRPITGWGFGTYASVQSQFMSPDLARFNPLNQEAKCLYLNVAAEFGLIGIAVLIWLGFDYLRLVRAASLTATRGSLARSVVDAIHAYVIAMVISSLFDTPFLTPGRFSTAFVTSVVMGIACQALHCCEGRSGRKEVTHRPGRTARSTVFPEHNRFGKVKSQ